MVLVVVMIENLNSEICLNMKDSNIMAMGPKFKKISLVVLPYRQHFVKIGNTI